MKEVRILNLRIDNCIDCPYFRFYPSAKGSGFPYELECIKKDKRIGQSGSPNLGNNAFYSPPDWCPLEKDINNFYETKKIEVRQNSVGKKIIKEEFQKVMYKLEYTKLFQVKYSLEKENPTPKSLLNRIKKNICDRMRDKIKIYFTMRAKDIPNGTIVTLTSELDYSLIDRIILHINDEIFIRDEKNGKIDINSEDVFKVPSPECEFFDVYFSDLNELNCFVDSL